MFSLEKMVEDKKKLRRQQAALPIEEKLQQLDMLRETAVLLHGAKLLDKTDEKPSASTCSVLCDDVK